MGLGAILKQGRKALDEAKIPRKEALPLLREQFVAEHPPIGSFDAATGKPVTEKLIRDRANAYVRKVENGPPAVLRRELLRLNAEIESVPQTERKIIHPEQLVGKVGVPVVGDRSIRLSNPTNRPYGASGQRGIVSIRGVPLSEEIYPEGGFGFTLDSEGTRKGWSSMAGIARKKQENMRLAAEETGMDPLGVYSALGMESIDFSTPILTSMVAQLDAIGIPKKELRAFDKIIREGSGVVKPVPDWVGLESPDVFDQLLGRDGYDREGSGALRLLVLNEMKKKRWENVGFPVYEDAVKTFTSPDLIDIPKAGSGFTIYRADPEADVFPEDFHLSYDTALPAKKGEENFGGLTGSLPPEVMFPSIFEELSQTINKAGRPFSYEEQTGSLMFNPKLYEPYTDEKVEAIIKYMNEKLGTDYAEGGAVTAPISVGQFDHIEIF